MISPPVMMAAIMPNDYSVIAFAHHYLGGRWSEASSNALIAVPKTINFTSASYVASRTGNVEL
jgi:hypothetical protein